MNDSTATRAINHRPTSARLWLQYQRRRVHSGYYTDHASLPRTKVISAVCSLWVIHFGSTLVLGAVCASVRPCAGNAQSASATRVCSAQTHRSRSDLGARTDDSWASRPVSESDGPIFRHVVSPLVDYWISKRCTERQNWSELNF